MVIWLATSVNMARTKLWIVPLIDTPGDPITLGMGFNIQKIKGMLTEGTFSTFRKRLSEDDLESLLAWDLCITEQFLSDNSLGPQERRAELLMRFAVAALRWLMPNRSTDSWFIQGFADPGKPFIVAQFGRQHSVFLEDAEWRSQLTHANRMREVASFFPQFELIVEDLLTKRYSYNPIVISAQLTEQAYHEFDSEIRLLKRIMALEALFSSESTYGKRALVPRVPKFIGAETEIYPGKAVPYTVGGVIQDLCELRNAFAHGTKVPDRFLNAAADAAISSESVKSYADVLREASATMLRLCLLRVFRDGLTRTFSDKAMMEALF